MAKRNHLDDFTRGRMIGKLEEKRTSTSVAADIGINKSVVSRDWKAFQTTGSVIGNRYCEEILLPHVRLFRGAIGPDFIFMYNNARPHRTLAVEELLETRLHDQENTQQLKQMLIEEWALLPQEMLHQLVLSMRRRCEATVALKLKYRVSGLKASKSYGLLLRNYPKDVINHSSVDSKLLRRVLDLVPSAARVSIFRKYRMINFLY
ncbi:transposable element Tcb2 transposase [Trichonephila clavipes]|nr:transposable element Tcb2 transposase [Trichonephila clavipes]